MYDKDLLRRYARFEITARDLPRDYFVEDDVEAADLDVVYQITVDDMMAAVGVIEKMDIRFLDYMDEWYGPMQYGYALWQVLGLGRYYIEEEMYDANSYRKVDPTRILPTDEVGLGREILDALGNMADDVWYDNDKEYDHVYVNGEEIEHDEDDGVRFDEDDDNAEPTYPLAREVLDLKYIRELVRCYESNKSLPVAEWDFPDLIKKRYMYEMDEAIHADLEPAEDYAELFRRYTEELAAEDDKDALEILGYQYYGGTSVYPCDWVRARDIFTDLFENTGDARYANTLGYIYYYGRTENGVPDNEKAFYYFSYGAADGIYESRYKIADMINQGRAVPQNKELAAAIVSSMYRENREEFESERYDGKFADLALRMGGISENGAGWMFQKDPETALMYYLQARLAIHCRKEEKYYGDNVVEKNIEEAIERVLPLVKVNTDRSKNMVEIDVTSILGDYLDENCYVTFKPEEDMTSITFRRANASDYLVTLPNRMYCKLLREITIEHCDGTGFVEEPDLRKEYVVTDMNYNIENESLEFYCGTEVICRLKPDGWTFDMDQENEEDDDM